MSSADKLTREQLKGKGDKLRELRIVVLGKNEEENIRVKTFISGRRKPEKELKERNISVIDSHLLQPNLSLHHITRAVRECVDLSHPGPHAFILVLQYNNFSEEDRFRVTTVLKEFSDQAMNRTILLTTDKPSYTSFFSSTAVQQLIKECEGRHLPFSSETDELRSKIFKNVEMILKENNEKYLRCKLSEEKDQSQDEETSRSKQKDSDQKQSNNPRKKRPNLNLVLCGPERTSHVSDLIRGVKKNPFMSQESRSKVCLSREMEIHGRLVNVVELPSLSQLSKELTMCETLRCVSLCDPGVHVFLLIIPSESLTDEDKKEIEEIEKRFQSREHFMVVETDVTGDGNSANSNAENQRSISLYGERYRVLALKEDEKSKQIPDLLEYIENMKTEPYSLHMFVRAQEMRERRETEKKYEEELKKMEDKIKELQEKIHSEGAEGEQEDLKGLRIVLIGKTGSGKSATGNTILRREEFISHLSIDSVTSVCEKGVCEVDGVSVSVVDTPGLFDTTLTNDKVMEELVKCVSLSSPGPHAFIIVLRLDRFTREESDTIDLIKKIFGPKAAQFSIVLFTRGDELKGESIEDFVKRSKSAELNKLIRDCGNRFLTFNNRETQDRSQVTRLMNMIDEMKTTNHCRYFTNSMFEEAEMSIKKKMEEILKEKEIEIQNQREELTAKHEMEKEKMMKRLEEEKKRADEERIKMEKNFREKEETLRKEFEKKEKTERLEREKEKQKQLEEEKQQRAEHLQKIEEMKKETEDQRSLYEQQQREREEEDRKREDKYRQDQEKMKHEQEQIITQLQKRQEEEIRKRESEEKKRHEEEERERQEWKIRIKETENETQDEIKRRQREWEEDKKQQMRERKEDERKKREEHEKHLREKQEEVEKMRMKIDKEREEERRQRDEEREKLKREKEEKEREHQEKKTEMMKHYEQQETERKETWERKHREDDERREEERMRWEKMIVDIKREKEEEIKRRETQERKRKEREEEEREDMMEENELRIKEMKKKHEDEARKQAEEMNEFIERKEKNVQELIEILEEHQIQHELLDEFYKLINKEENIDMEKLKQKIKKLKNKSHCVIL